MKIEFDDGMVIRINEHQEDWVFRIAKGSGGKWKSMELQTKADGGKHMDILKLGPEIRSQLTPFGNPSWADPRDMKPAKQPKMFTEY